MERKLKISRTSLRAYRDRAEASGKAMVDLLKLEDAELNAIMVKGDGHRSRDAERYAFMQENIEEYAQQMKRADFGDDHPGISAITTHLS